jgi:hypothetical protein
MCLSCWLSFLQVAYDKEPATCAVALRAFKGGTSLQSTPCCQHRRTRHQQPHTGDRDTLVALYKLTELGTSFRAYKDCSTALACARPTVMWVQSTQRLFHHPRMCSSHSDVGSEHTTVGHHPCMCSSHRNVGSEHTMIVPPPLHVFVPQCGLTAYVDCSTTLACARPTVAWVQSIQQLVHHPCMCSSHSDVGSEHTLIVPSPLACACAAVTQSWART